MENCKEIEEEFPYRSRWTTLAFAGGFFGLCGGFFMYRALTDDRGVVINGLITLAPHAARLVYWGLAIGSFAFVAASIFLAIARLSTSHRIAISSDAILFPAGRWTSRECAVPFAGITEVKHIETHGQEFLYIYAGGLRYTIAKGMLPSNRDFEVITAILQGKLASTT